MSSEALAITRLDTALLQPVLENWGNLHVCKERVREVQAFVAKQGLSDLAAWLAPKGTDKEPFLVRDLAVFCLLFNETALLKMHADDTAVAFDLMPEIRLVHNMQRVCVAKELAEREALESFERELDSLVLEASAPAGSSPEPEEAASRASTARPLSPPSCPCVQTQVRTGEAEHVAALAAELTPELATGPRLPQVAEEETHDSEFEVDLRPLDAEYELNAEIAERFSDKHTGEGSFSCL